MLSESKKSRIRETKHLSTDADSSTDTTVGWTKNTPKPNFFEKRKKSSKTQKHLEICQNLQYTLRPDVSNPSGSVVSTMFCKQNQQQKNFFLRGNFRPLPSKTVQIWDHFFPLLFPKDSESLKILDIRLREVGAKRLVNGMRTPIPKISCSVRQNSPQKTNKKIARGFYTLN